MEHTCLQNGHLKKVEVGAVVDVSAEMKQMIEDSCIADAIKSASGEAKFVFNSILKKYKGRCTLIFKKLMKMAP